MKRPLIYTAELIRDYDAGSGWRDGLEGLAQACADVLGQTDALVTGLSAGPQSPASMSINISPGAMYQFIQVDPTAAGSLPASSDVEFVQATLDAVEALVLSTSGLASGQSRWALIEAQVQFIDSIREGDPDGGVLGFENAGNPLGPPLEGPGGSGQTLPTVRAGTVVVQVKYGTPATTGSEVPPDPDSGWTGLYLIDLAFGQTTIILGDILVAGPSVGTGVPGDYPAAPFLQGLLNSHHGGVPGQAPQIKLGSEVQGTLGLANLPASSSASGVLPVLRSGAGAPSGSVAGNTNDLYFDTTEQNLYLCTAGGTALSATWVSVVTVAGATPTGSAGGDLAGSYPNPSVAQIQGKAVATPTVTKSIPYYNGTSIAWLTGDQGIIKGRYGSVNLRGNPGGSSSQFTITADFVSLIQSDGTVILVTGLNSTVDINTSGPAANGRDQSAAFSSNTFFHLYAIGGGGNTPALIASLTSPAGGAGPTLSGTYTAWAYVGTLLIGITPAIVHARIRGNRITYDAQQALSVNPFSANTETTISVSNFVPAIAQRFWLNIFAKATSSGGVADEMLPIRVTSGNDYYELQWRLNVNLAQSCSDTIDIPNQGQQFLTLMESSIGNPFANFWIRGYDVPNGAW